MRAFDNLTPLAKFNSLKNQLERFTPKYRRMLATNSKVLRDAIPPGIEKCEVSRSTLMSTLQFSTPILSANDKETGTCSLISIPQIHQAS